jgi:hypothetical protein
MTWKQGQCREGGAEGGGGVMKLWWREKKEPGDVCCKGIWKGRIKK